MDIAFNPTKDSEKIVDFQQLQYDLKKNKAINRKFEIKNEKKEILTENKRVLKKLLTIVDEKDARKNRSSSYATYDDIKDKLVQGRIRDRRVYFNKINKDNQAMSEKICLT